MRVWWVLVLVRPMSEAPIRNDWLRLEVPNTPGATSTPLKWASKLTLVFSGQYCLVRKLRQTTALPHWVSHSQAPTTGLELLISIARSTLARNLWAGRSVPNELVAVTVLPSVPWAVAVTV